MQHKYVAVLFGYISIASCDKWLPYSKMYHTIPDHAVNKLYLRTNCLKADLNFTDIAIPFHVYLILLA